MSVLFLELPGFWELAVILLLGVVMFGKRTPEMARKIGKVYIRARRFMDSLYVKYLTPLEIEVDSDESEKRNKENLNKNDNKNNKGTEFDVKKQSS